MTDSCKRLAVGGDNLDRLTSLPINVIHQIQECMPVEDATRMSVLSSTWRYVWSSNPKLVFDTQFCTKRTLADTIDIISTILFQHQGAVKTFSLNISRIISSQHSVVDKWMQFLSRNGLVDLTIQNHNNANAPYKLPSYMYRVVLERLVLLNCIFRPPYSFRGFQKLKCLVLVRVAFELEVATSSLLMPNLVSMRVYHCSGLCSLNIYAPKLLYLYIYESGADILKLSPFMDCGKLQTVAITSSKEVSLNRKNKEMKLTNLISSWPNVQSLLLGRYFLEFLASGTELERLPTSLNRLRFLSLHNYDFDSEDQISPLLCILRSSPNLKRLTVTHNLPRQRKKSDVGVDINLLAGADCRTQGLDNLQVLLIRKLHGSSSELHFVRFILASAPLLRKAVLLVDTSVHESQFLKISKELTQFPRASPKLKIIYEPWSDEQDRKLETLF